VTISDASSSRSRVRAIVAGIGGGAVSILMFYSAVRSGPGAGTMLVAFMPLPTLIAGVGWGIAAALSALATGALLIACLGPMQGVLDFAMAVGLPALLVTHMASLARYDAQGAVTGWYPAGHIIWALALYGAAFPVFAMLGVDQVALGRALGDVITKIVATLPADSEFHDLTGTHFETTVAVGLLMVPMAIAVYWTLLFAINVYVAARIVKFSDRLARPWPDLHWLTLPPVSLAALGAALVALAFDGPPRTLAVGALGAFLIAFLLQGLSLFHCITAARGTKWLTFLVYALLAVVGAIAVPIVVLTGLLESAIGFRRRIFSTPANLPMGSL
jgi:predicted membrane protein DUF2232